MTPASGDDVTVMGGEARSPTPGSLFAGRYLVEKRIGEGGMGSVHAVLDRELGERVALKVLTTEGTLRPETVERFRREVRVARKITHRNAARTFDIGEHAGLHFLTMELVEGESLAALLGRGPLAPERVIEIGRQICDGLGAVHEAGIVHRDLKPANVLLEAGGRVVLTDFGVARSTIEDDGVTREGVLLVGTPRYMAPEQVAGEPLTPRTDLYALGLLLYEAATGRLPFAAKDAIGTAMARLHELPESPLRHVDLPPPLTAAIMACLERDPARRPASAAALRAMLGGEPEASTGTGEGSDPMLAASSAPSGTDSSGSHRFASLDVGEQCLAVLPLRYRGPADDAYLAEALTEQLIDLLSMTRGLRVPAAGATEPFADRRDPRAVREALGVDAVVDGTMQKGGSQLRVAIRLVDAHTGYQTWSERFDGELEDVFQLQDRIATKVAETLRLQLESTRFRFTGPPEAMELYMRARVRMRNYHLGGTEPDGAPALLRRCLDQAPDFAPALAAYAMVCARMWFFYGQRDGEHEWAAECERSVARALEVGPGLPDTHLAAARMYWQLGRFRESARALQQALDLAPTHAAAHGYLGVLQCEAGRSKEGFEHIELALELEPTDVSPLLTAVHHMALHGDHERLEASIRRVWDTMPDARFPIKVMRLRIALWHRDPVEIRRWRDALSHVDKPFRPFVEVVASHVLGEATADEVQASLDANAPPTASLRYRALVEQVQVEGLLARGELEPALEGLERLAAGVLVDVDWLEHCPLMEPLRADPRMFKVRAKVRERAQAIWTIR
ncbi:MAG: protein kinase [Myxococcales bacterium]|nr:protein kinase [Myxococcales bacterium]